MEMRTKITNPLGLHARPAAQFVKIAATFESEIFVSNGVVEVNGKSIMGVLTLAAEHGSEITIRAEGPDAQAAVERLVKLVSSGFGEE
ncbi:MAG: HPr family phosphocarrier protein [Gemmatimonadales bacterium]